MRIAVKQFLLLSLVPLMVLSSGCRAQPVPVPGIKYSIPELKYRLVSRFGNVFWCDPDYYPVARPGQEEKNATELFPAIRAEEAEFSAIIEHLSLPNKGEYTDDEKLQVYREHKKLKYAVQITPTVDEYDFMVRVAENQGERIEGTVSSSGVIKILKREPSFNTCPICLVRGTLIDTPDGQMSVEHLREGMAVWTLDEVGRRIVAVIIKTESSKVDSPFTVIRVSLNDGRTVTASSGHPTADERALGDYHVGDTLDGASITTMEQMVYDGCATYDLLPSGITMLYWANDILLKSTIATD